MSHKQMARLGFKFRRARSRSDRMAMMRARRLYARICWKVWKKVPHNKRAKWLDYIAAAGIRHGLYAIEPQTKRQKETRTIPKGAMRNARYNLCRHWQKLDGYDGSRGWYRWLNGNGIRAYTFEYIGRKLKVA